MAMLDETVILLVEDNEGHANLIQRNLERAGITNKIMIFDDGLKVVNFLFMAGDGPKRTPQTAYAILLDIRIPVMDGIEVLKAIKSNEKLKSIPVIVLTTTDEPVTIEKCNALGCTDYITKPSDYEQFIEAINNIAQSLETIEIPVIN